MLLQLPEQKLHSHLVMALHAYSPRPHRAACQGDHKQSKVTEQYVPELLCFRRGIFFGSCDTPPTPLFASCSIYRADLDLGRNTEDAVVGAAAQREGDQRQECRLVRSE